MNTIGTHHAHHHSHHAVPLAIAGGMAILATALLTGPVHLSFGGDDDPPAAPVPHLFVGAGAAAATGRCVSSGHPGPLDVPAPACRPGGIDTVTTTAARSAQSAAPVPCFRQFRAWPEDEARPVGCD